MTNVPLNRYACLLLFYFGQIFSALVVTLLPDPESQEQCLIFIFELICEEVNVDISAYVNLFQMLQTQNLHLR